MGVELNLVWYSDRVLNAVKYIQKRQPNLSFEEALKIVKLGIECGKADLLQKVYHDGIEVYTNAEVPLIMRESEIKVDLTGGLDVLFEKLGG